MSRRPLALTKTDMQQIKPISEDIGGIKQQFEFSENYLHLLNTRLEVSGLAYTAHGKTRALGLYKKEMAENVCLVLLNEMRDVKY